MRRLTPAAWFLLVAVVIAPVATAKAGDASVLAFREPTALVKDPSGAVLGRKFLLPASAHVGEGSWYYVRLKLRLVTAEFEGWKPVIISSALNGLTSNRVEVRQRTGVNCETINEWNSVDLFRGFVRQRHCGHELSLVSLNFVQRRSVRPGMARFLVQASGSVGANDSVIVLPGSGIYRTSHGPGRLAFLPFDSDISLQRGHWAKFPFRLRNLGGRPVRRISVSVAPSKGLAFRMSRVAVPGLIAPGTQRAGTFWVKARRSGRFKLIVGASSSANHPGMELTVFAGGEASETYAALRNASLAVALIGTALLTYLFLRRRSCRRGNRFG
jgi:hypothetical protein